MARKKQTKKEKGIPAKKEEIVMEVNEEQNTPKELSNITLLIFTLLLAVVYFIFSTFSDGFYQHDEVGHYLGMRSFWHDPFAILGAFQKPGYKFLTILPALGGYTFLKFFNSLVAAFTVYFAYKLLQKLGSKNSILIFFILGIQPLWFMLAFRNFSEIFAAFLLTLAALNHFNKKYIMAALLMSYLAFVRQEYHTLLGLYFFVLLFKKQWIPLLLTGTFTLFHNLYGYISTGDLLYLPNSIIAYSERIKDVWPKQGFDHYFLMSNIIFGSIALVLFTAYIAIVILKKKKPNWILLIPVILIFFLNCALNSQSFEFGPGNGGNLRYLVIITPLLSILGVRALDEIIGFDKKQLLLIFLLPLLLLIGAYQTYEHNFIHLSEVEDWKPLIFAVITVLLLLLPLKAKHYVLTFSFLAILVAVVNVNPFKIQPEEQTIKKAAKWYAQYLEKPKTEKEALFTEDSRVVCGHGLFYFYLGKTKYDFNKEAILNLTKEVTDTLKKGDLLIWESHYGYRPKLRPTSQKLEYYQNNPKYRTIQYYFSKDRRFRVDFFQKLED